MLEYVLGTNNRTSLQCNGLKLVDGKKIKKVYYLQVFCQVYVPKTCNKNVVIKSDNLGCNNVVNIIRKKHLPDYSAIIFWFWGRFSGY